ncbi:MAG: hypothetical protein HYV27_07365 [Candidatus Hydrogenedentes bacterium]|nr:hypothetical protein [Candidatus Hydrogenedentota bacterium]
MVGEVAYTDGHRGNIVLVGPRSNPKGAALLIPGGNAGKPATKLFPDGIDLLGPELTVELLCMQERAFGACGLPKPLELD